MKKISLILISIYIFSICKADNWKSGIGISDFSVNSIIEYNIDTLLAGTENNGIFISYDKGNHWTQFSLKDETILSLLKVGKTVIAGTDNSDIYKADSINSKWNKITINNLTIYSIKLHNDTIFACGGGTLGPGSIYTSTDTGKTWHKYNTTPPYVYLDIDFSLSGRTYVTTSFGAYYSDNQAPWILTKGDLLSAIWTVSYIGSNSIIYGNHNYIFLSTNNGVSAQYLNSLGGRTFFIDDTIYITGLNIMYSSDLKKDWDTIPINKSINTLSKIQNILFIGTTTGIYYGTKTDSTTESITIINNINKNMIKIFPNPTTGIFEIIGLKDELLNIEFYNLTGCRILESKSLINDISTMKNGIYFLKVKYRNKILITKLIKY
jgi:hypothetical protein